MNSIIKLGLDLFHGFDQMEVWLKLAVGGALLVATHAVLRRATSSRDAPEPEERSREETPSVIDRRMTLIAEEPPKASTPQTSRQIVDEEEFKNTAPIVKTAPIIKPNIVEVVKEKTISFDQTKIPDTKDDEKKELYSDEDEEVEEEEEEEVQSKTIVTPQQTLAQAKEKEDSEPEEVPDDVEIIEDEQVDEELEEEEDEVEEEISDVDDAELLSRLEAKYGRLPEPERPGKQHSKQNCITCPVCYKTDALVSMSQLNRLTSVLA